jgi:hypothetical protein
VLEYTKSGLQKEGVVRADLDADAAYMQRAWSLAKRSRTLTERTRTREASVPVIP